MSGYLGNGHSEQVKMEQAKMEQIITEFFAKSLHIILESRTTHCVSSRNFSGDQGLSSPCSSSSSSSSVRPRDKWFNLALQECPAALENLDLWRQSNLEPMVVDVVLVKRPLDWGAASPFPRKGLVRNVSLKERYSSCWNSDQESFGSDPKREKVLERWVVQYESRKAKDWSSGKRRSSNNLLHVLYKKSILLLRSLYTTVRLLPAYKIFRDVNSSGQMQPFTLAHRVSSFVEPFTRREEAEMQHFGFNPVDTSCGRLCLSVLYRVSLSDVISEPSTPMSPQVIHDYVGSPLADPLKRLPSLPVSRGSPSSLPFSRRHSWSYDQNRASSPSISYSPSPTHSDFHASVSYASSRGVTATNLPPLHPPETSLVHKKNTNFDEYCLSPNYTPSQSPSSPIYIPGSHQSKDLLRTGSAPVKIPVYKVDNSSSFSKQNLHPKPTPKALRLLTYDTDQTVEKLSVIGKDEGRRYSGLRISSNNSQQISLSRTSSRSFTDDFDDSEFACAFDVDDDITDPGSRPDSFDHKGHLSEPSEPGGFFPVRKSQDAAVGALVHMLKKAAPLRRESSSSISISKSSRPDSCSNIVQEPNQISKDLTVQHITSLNVASSGIGIWKTTADALAELRSYREMKTLLLQQGDKSLNENEKCDMSNTIGP